MKSVAILMIDMAHIFVKYYPADLMNNLLGTQKHYALRMEILV